MINGIQGWKSDALSSGTITQKVTNIPGYDAENAR